MLNKLPSRPPTTKDIDVDCLRVEGEDDPTHRNILRSMSDARFSFWWNGQSRDIRGKRCSGLGDRGIGRETC